LIFQDRNGTLEIVYEGEADLRLHDGGIQIFDSNNQLKYTLSPSERNRSLPPGSYRVKVIGTDGVKLETESFEMAQAGVFTLRATAKPADPVENNLHDEKRETPVHLDQAFFPGRVVVWENFTDADRCSIPISANQKVEDHRFIAMKSDCMVNALLPLDLGPNLETGAGFIRCRGVNSRVFFNFATRQTQDQFRWLGVNNPKPVLWCINIHRQDLENGLWTAKPSTRVSESFIEVADSAPGKWLEFAFRWSPRTYDVWLNNRYLGGGELPSEELTIGKPKAMQLAAIAATAGNIQLEIDSLGIWDQSDLMGGDELPATLTRDTK
jgi:hypothetical protein